MNVKLLTEHHLEFLSLKEGCTGSYESPLVKSPIVGNHMSQLIWYVYTHQRLCLYTPYVMFIHTICYVYTYHMLCFSASPFIHTIYSSHADGHPSLTLICNTTQATHQSIESTSFRWLLPDGSARYGRILVIDNVTLQHSGKYVCIMKQTIDGEKMSASSSTLITAGNSKSCGMRFPTMWHFDKCRLK